jgi:hypothetical protein
VADRVQAEVVARVPGAAALGLVAPPGADVVAATYLADPGWTADVLGDRARRQRTGDRRVLATVWWYSVSTVLLTPPLAGLLTGRPLSARLEDVTVAMLPGPQPIAAESAAAARDPVAELRGTLAAVVAAVAEAVFKKVNYWFFRNRVLVLVDTEVQNLATIGQLHSYGTLNLDGRIVSIIKKPDTFDSDELENIESIQTTSINRRGKIVGDVVISQLS